MDACSIYTTVSTGSFGRRAFSGPAILMKLKAQSFKECISTESGTTPILRRANPPPYTPAIEATKIKEPESYLASPARPFPRRRKDIAAKMQRGGLGGNPEANSCPPLIGLGLGVEFKRGEDPTIASDEEVRVSKGAPDLIPRQNQTRFQAVHEYANYARARAQIALGYVVPIPYCDVEPLVALKDEPTGPPEYNAPYPEAEPSEAPDAMEAESKYSWGWGYESQSMDSSDSGASEVGGTVYYVRNIVEYGAPSYCPYW